MNKKSKSKARGEQKDVLGKTQLVSPSTNGAKTVSTSDTLGSSAEVKSQVGFQPTKPLSESDETTNARLVVTFAAKLGALVVWKKFELGDGQEVIALCFPTNSWTTNADGELVVKDEKK